MQTSNRRLQDVRVLSGEGSGEILYEENCLLSGVLQTLKAL